MSELPITNPSLKIFFEKEARFTQHKSILDGVSSDIKLVEAHLKENGISKSVRMVAGQQSKNSRELIAWMEYRNQGMRLIYERQQHCENTGYWLEYEQKPLIEAKSDVRIRLIGELPNFLALLQMESGLALKDDFLPF
jgi:hypothetical protein